MTVKELIAALEEFPANAVVLKTDDSGQERLVENLEFNADRKEITL